MLLGPEAFIDVPLSRKHRGRRVMVYVSESISTNKVLNIVLSMMTTYGVWYFITKCQGRKFQIWHHFD